MARPHLVFVETADGEIYVGYLGMDADKAQKVFDELATEADLVSVEIVNHISSRYRRSPASEAADAINHREAAAAKERDEAIAERTKASADLVAAKSSLKSAEQRVKALGDLGIPKPPADPAPTDPAPEASAPAAEPSAEPPAAPAPSAEDAVTG